MAGDGSSYPRLLAGAVREALEDTPVVCLLGPRQCGKTTLIRQLAPDRPCISLGDEKYRKVAQSDPLGFVEALPRTITLDEAQRVPELLPAIKLEVDRDRRPGRFLLLGCSQLRSAARARESLAGRVEIVQLHPLTEAERERQSGRFLKTVLESGFHPRIGERSSRVSPTLPERIVAGGYPAALTRSARQTRSWWRKYLHGLIERDVQDLVPVRHVRELSRLVEVQATNTAMLWNASKVARALGLHRETADQYLVVLEQLFLLRILPAWYGEGPKRLVRGPKIHLLDSGLAASLAKLSAEDWLGQRDRMGRLVESFAVQQIIAQGAWTDPGLRFWHYRDKDQVEVALVLTRGSKTWGIEVTASATLGPQDGQGLRRLAAASGEDFQSGLVLYNGPHVLPLGGGRILAVPLSALWDR